MARGGGVTHFPYFVMFSAMMVSTNRIMLVGLKIDVPGEASSGRVTVSHKKVLSRAAPCRVSKN